MKKRKPKKIKRKSRKGKKPKKRGKATFAQSLQRQRRIYKMLVDGRQRRYIMDYCVRKWGLHSTQIDNYIAKCNEAFREVATFNRQDVLGQRVEQVYDLYIESRKAKARQISLGCLRELDKLQALIDINIDLKGEITLERRLEGMSDEEISKVGAEISARLAQHGVNLKGAGKKKAPKASGE